MNVISNEIAYTHVNRDNNHNLLLCVDSAMTKTTQRPVRLLFKCQRWDEEKEKDRAYTRLYDLVAHLFNKHKLFPISIRHNAPYLAVKSDLRPATAEETAKYKDANNHRRKKADDRASTGEASASGTTVENEVPPGREARTTKCEQGPSGDKGKEQSRGREAKNEGKKSRTDSSRDDARIAKKTADGKNLADEESDKYEYIALQNKMEARRIAREIQTAHDTLAALWAAQDIMSPRRTIAFRPSLAIDKAEVGNAPASQKEVRKARAPRKTVELTGSCGAIETIRAPRNLGAKPKAKGAASTAEVTCVATAKTAVRAEDDDSMTEVLGPALVAGALGRKIGDARTATMIQEITECRVELLSTRQKAKRPVPKAPDNSREADNPTERIEVSGARLSLLATDQHVQLELPGDIMEENRVATGSSRIKKTSVGKKLAGADDVEPRPVLLTSVKKTSYENCEELVRDVGTNDAAMALIGNVCGGDDEPTAPGLVETPVATNIDSRTDSCERKTLKAPTTEEEMGESWSE